jgi:uncharacterized membrane protein
MTGSLTRPLRIALIASLALNLFAIGAVGAAAIGGGGWIGDLVGLRQPSRLTGMPSPRQLRAVLDDADRAILAAALDARRPAFRENLRAMFDARETVAQAIAAEPFDRARVETAFAVLREREAAVATAAQGTILDLVARLDADGRAKVAGLMKRRHKPRETSAP